MGEYSNWVDLPLHYHESHHPCPPYKARRIQYDGSRQNSFEQVHRLLGRLVSPFAFSPISTSIFLPKTLAYTQTPLYRKVVAINLPILETTTNGLNGSVVIVKEPERPIPATASLGFDYPCYNAVDGNHGGAEFEGFRIKNGDHGIRDGNHYGQDVDRYMEWGFSGVWPGWGGGGGVS